MKSKREKNSNYFSLEKKTLRNLQVVLLTTTQCVKAGRAVDSECFIHSEHSFPSFLAAGWEELNLAGLRCRKPDSTVYGWIGNTGLNVFEVKIKP